MTNLPHEFDASGIPSLRPDLNYLLENGAAQHVKFKRGKSERYVIIIDGKNINIRVGTALIKILEGRLSRYIQVCRTKVQTKHKILIVLM